MASAWPEEEAFACPVCLDTLKEPATLPCGHSYCLACIQRHWDRTDSQGGYSCPQCRQLFRPRPSLAKSTLLVEAMEKLRANSLKHSSSSTPVYLEVLPDAGPEQGDPYPRPPPGEARPCPQPPPGEARPCPRHRRPLDLFCRDHNECVCSECCQDGHEGHRVVGPEAERAERQEELLQQQAHVQRRLQEAERTLNEIPHFARQHQALVQALQQETADSFAELVESLNLAASRVHELLSDHEASLGSRAEGRINRLEQEVAQLHRRSAELTRLADMKDPVCFLKNFLAMEPLGQGEGAGESAPPPEEEVVVVVAGVRSTTKQLQESVKVLVGGGLEKIGAILNPEPLPAAAGGAGSGPDRHRSTVSEGTPPAAPAPPDGASGPPPRAPVLASAPPLPVTPPLRKCADPLGGSTEPRPVFGSPAQPAAASAHPEPKTREELLKFRFEPTLDPNTAYRHLQLSDGGRRAALKAENLNPPEHPDRFHFWRQVLCREPLGGSPYYWEVEWTGPKITVAVAHREMTRKSADDSSRLGHNALSWSLYWSGTGFSFWHNGQEKLLGSPKARRIGVYLDQHAGVLSFHRIANNQAHLIHRHQNQFSGPLFPGLRFGSAVGAAATICQLD